MKGVKRMGKVYVMLYALLHDIRVKKDVENNMLYALLHVIHAKKEY